MAATESQVGIASRWGPLVAAALALPGTAAAQGLAPAPAAVGPGPAALGGVDAPAPLLQPDANLIALRWLSYRDWQPGLRRIRVESPSAQVRLAVGSQWSVEGSATLDSVSGASPRYHTAVSGASQMTDRRKAWDVRVTRLAPRSGWSVAAAGSDENDYRSRAASLRHTRSSDDNNRTWTLEAGLRHDRIGSVNAPSLDRQRHTSEVAATITQALSRRDLAQATVSLSDARGFHSDPYKLPDLRPERRRQQVLNLRWNHHFDEPDVVLRTSWRLYADSFGVRSQTLGLESVVAATSRLAVTPSLRLYTQSAARFYYDPRYAYAGIPMPAGYVPGPGAYLSADQRLAAFGAVTVGVAMALDLGDGWTLDGRLDRYEQRTSWRFLREGSRGLEPLKARFLQVGLARRF